MLLQGGKVYRKGRIIRGDVLVDGGSIAAIAPSVSPNQDDQSIDCTNFVIVPGFVDVHVHLREPGFLWKETIKTGTAAAARGGYTAVCTMPNLNPVPDSPEHLKVQLDAIARDALVKVLPLGAITAQQKGEQLADIAGMSADVWAYSDDGHGVQSDDMMRAAMVAARAQGRVIAAHCEVDALLHGGYIHDGRYARAHGHRGISGESEWAQIARDIALVRETGCRYHALHISTKESAELIRRAKAEGLPVTCETGPHYLCLCEDDLRDEGRYKMNPPLRARADMEALIEALSDGTVDCIATDHAPHAETEKDKGLSGSAMGITGLETALPVLYTRLVLTGKVTLETVLNRLCDRPRALVGLPEGLAVGGPADLAVLDLETPYTIDSAAFLSMGRATPFDGEHVRGRSVLTMVNGHTVWDFNRGGIIRA